MKKLMKRLTCGLMAMLMSFSFVGCFGDDDGGGNSSDTTPKNYTVQYTDDQGTHQLEVTEGMPYAMETVPQKTGYDFLGLFDSEVGGTQYVSSTGASLAPFSDSKNMVLFPQFKAKEYTVVLDYQGAAVTGSRQLTVAYNTQIPELPKNLTLEHKEFSGWYTEKDCGGVQVADEYGILPVVSTLNEKNFDISNADGYIYLYAGFEAETFTVTFHFGDGIPSEEMEVAYNTPISQVVPNTRNSDGFAVLSWSKTADGSQVFTGNITDGTILYAAEWAPCINFDSNGGESVNAIVARSGATVSLPTTTKDLAKFMYWETTSGTQAILTKMPESSITLKAVWQGKLVFDENGGTEVDDISVAANQTITLPTPEKEGYIFAGWYTADKDLYSSPKMPVAGVKLKAGWYKAKKEKVIIVENNSVYDPSGNKNEEFMADKLQVNLSGFLSSSFSGQIKMSAHMKVKCSAKDYTSTPYILFNYYSANTASSSNLLASQKVTIANSAYKEVNFNMSFALTGNMIYCSRTCNYDPDNNDYMVSDYYLDIEYPDTSYLYL